MPGKPFLRFNKARLVHWLALLLTCGFVLSAAHVHSLDEYGDVGLQDQYTQCAAYHVVDHQLAVAEQALAIGQIVDSCYYAFISQPGVSTSVLLPPSRGPPVSS